MTQKRTDSITEYIQNSNKGNFVTEMKTAQIKLHNHIDVYIKNSLPEGFDIEHVLTKIEQLIPPFLMMDIDALIIGDFEMLNKRDVDAAYEDGAIYLTNAQENEADMFDDVVHEVAHSVEKNYGMEIFGDGQVETEFINKRRMLYSVLNAHDFRNLSMYDYINPEYDEKFDKFLYKTVGYDKLRHLIGGLFLSPYAATSVSEYWANGFEAIFTGEDPKYIKQTCPALYEKLIAIVQAGQFQPADEMENQEEEGWINDGY